MSKTRNKWMISIIAQFDSTSDIVKETYNELEQSILCQKPDERIRYAILLYDQRTETACIKRVRYSYYGPHRFEVKELGTVNFYSGEPLKEFFKANSSDPAFDCRHMVITWGHGAGYGFFSESIKRKESFGPDKYDQDKINYELQFLKSQYSIPDQYLYHKEVFQFNESLGEKKNSFDKWVTNIRQDTRAISVGQLKDIITDTMKKADVLLTMNCFMQTFEAGYILKDAVDMMISPQTIISFYGYNYVRMFGLLHDNPSCELKDIAENLCTYYLVKFSEEPIRECVRKLGDSIVDPKKLVAFSAQLLKGYTDLNNLLNRISEYLVTNFTPVMEERCKMARRKCLSLKSEGLVDFRHFFVELCRYYDTDLHVYKSDLRPFHEELLNLREQYQLSLVQPGTVLEAELARDFLPAIGAQFFSIFFPIEVGQATIFSRSVLFGYGEVMKDSGWIRFIEKMNGIGITIPQAATVI